ncbi:hypothetical protein FQN54_007641 [Arachnomyces sp. PD_36]|nr:hypothetical protein FQN54_007641 [Arachnomyces sp. PD_36]
MPPDNSSGAKGSENVSALSTNPDGSGPIGASNGIGMEAAVEHGVAPGLNALNDGGIEDSGRGKPAAANPPDECSNSDKDVLGAQILHLKSQLDGLMSRFEGLSSVTERSQKTKANEDDYPKSAKFVGLNREDQVIEEGQLVQKLVDSPQEAGNRQGASHGFPDAPFSGFTPSPTKKTIPKLHRVVWTDFAKWPQDQIDDYAIDVFMESTRSFSQRRREEGDLEGRMENVTVSGSQPTESHLGEDESLSKDQHDMLGHIRINSKKPYKFLVYYEKDIRRRLSSLETKWPKAGEDAGEGVTADEPEIIDPNDDSNATSEVARDSINDSALKETTSDFKALGSLRCLVEFMDQDVIPVHRKYREASTADVFFNDLWYLYQPGDEIISSQCPDGLICAGCSSCFGVADSTGKGTNIWRVLRVYQGRNKPGALPNLNSDPPPSQKANSFRILCYKIAYNGALFGPISHTFDFKPFVGKRKITTLDPIPLNFVAGCEDIRAAAAVRGKAFMQYTKPSHRFYTGLSLQNHPGLPCNPAGKPTLVEGNVIVDFKEAARDNSQWVPKLALPEIMDDWDTGIYKDYFPYIFLDCFATENLVSHDAFLCGLRNKNSREDFNGRNFQEGELVLLPDRVCAFNLRKRKFCILSLQGLQPVEAKGEGWNNLKLPRGHKRILQAQVKSHFREKRLRENIDQEAKAYDTVRRKGEGLTILLHGVPSVGKTSTAECLAESLRKPLYPITSGDLGVSAKELEETLSRTFAKAESWGCVLLLDEADVFLAQRTRTDLERNAVVSVFLRALEYSRGVVILTTNRVGALDEAFKSRIHLHLYYPPLNKDQTMSIWKTNLELIKRSKKGYITVDEEDIILFAANHFEYHKNRGTRWNGRQIRNAFQAATSMAEEETMVSMKGGRNLDEESTEQVVAHLDASHFRAVADTYSQFDTYIAETIGGTDSERALMDRERADHFKWMAAQNPALRQYDTELGEGGYPSYRPQPGQYPGSGHNPLKSQPRGNISGDPSDYMSQRQSYRQGQTAWDDPSLSLRPQLSGVPTGPLHVGGPSPHLAADPYLSSKYLQPHESGEASHRLQPTRLVVGEDTTTVQPGVRVGQGQGASFADDGY